MKWSLIYNQQKQLTHLLAVLFLFIIFTSCGKSESRTAQNTLEEEEWETIFNGKDLEGWTAKLQHHESGDNYANTFRVVDGMIQVNYEDYESFDERYGHLFYKKPYSSFHLKFDYRFTDQWMEDAPSYTYRNSGVMFHSQDPETILKEQDWPISVEYQMLADAGDGKPRPTGNMCSPGTEVFFNGEMDPRHCISSSSPTFPWDEWVHAELIVYGDSIVIHKVNGEIVLEYTHPQVGGGVAQRFDPAYKVDGQMLKEGYIGLQAEGQGVEFKHIEIKELD
ncbi:3-keto-disaccharide hydrolase [Cyclobacterium qasimii]|uniref:3-keto-alpha-glucoside-1,2-lyase/3-keto-2-hydroxy-glucal hydratase domain-containing protein n=2 Tax=Cyclobacterium qasimii TaxID=1350429 RepID=S7VDE9_9BACT|nr:DUF1080 domain-containing protein [Cyclobacterium qasimii]EPR68235.1 hypothetical protein ADICYQ_2705 [Cyclobacterium qasimii M12-11B]GEO19810.1 hypothetical protein CQA01_03440 [Cyclobacterium qasimii]